MKLETDFGGIKGVLPPSGEWQAVHRGIIQRQFEIEIRLPDDSLTKDYSGVLDARWISAGDGWELQLLNRENREVSLRIRWYIPASERLCCYDYGREG